MRVGIHCSIMQSAVSKLSPRIDVSAGSDQPFCLPIFLEIKRAEELSFHRRILADAPSRELGAICRVARIRSYGEVQLRFRLALLLRQPKSLLISVGL